MADFTKLAGRRTRYPAEGIAGPVAGVPGFYFDAHPQAWALKPSGAGILIPIWDLSGLLIGFQLRLHEPLGPLRYLQVSTGDASKWPGGASLGVPAGVWRPDLADQGTSIIEGQLKA